MLGFMLTQRHTHSCRSDDSISAAGGEDRKVRAASKGGLPLRYLMWCPTSYTPPRRGPVSQEVDDVSIPLYRERRRESKWPEDRHPGLVVSHPYLATSPFLQRVGKSIS